MKQEKCIIEFDGEWLVIFWGTIDGEIVGIITYAIPSKLPRQFHLFPARES